MTATQTTGSFRPKHRADALDLLRSVIKDHPTESERFRTKAFLDLVLEDETFKEYAVDALKRWLALVYNDAEKSVFPPDKAKLKKDADAAKKDRKEREQAEAEARKVIREKLIKHAYNFIANRTFAEAAQLGGMYTKISKLGKPNQIVSDVFDEKEFKDVILG